MRIKFKIPCRKMKTRLQGSGTVPLPAEKNWGQVRNNWGTNGKHLGDGWKNMGKQMKDKGGTRFEGSTGTLPQPCRNPAGTRRNPPVQETGSSHHTAS